MNLSWPNPIVFGTLGKDVQGLLTGQKTVAQTLADLDAAWEYARRGASTRVRIGGGPKSRPLTLRLVHAMSDVSTASHTHPSSAARRERPVALGGHGRRGRPCVPRNKTGAGTWYAFTHDWDGPERRHLGPGSDNFRQILDDPASQGLARKHDQACLPRSSSRPTSSGSRSRLRSTARSRRVGCCGRSSFLPVVMSATKSPTSGSSSSPTPARNLGFSARSAWSPSSAHGRATTTCGPLDDLRRPRLAVRRALDGDVPRRPRRDPGGLDEASAVDGRRRSGASGEITRSSRGGHGERALGLRSPTSGSSTRCSPSRAAVPSTPRGARDRSTNRPSPGRFGCRTALSLTTTVLITVLAVAQLLVLRARERRL